MIKLNPRKGILSSKNAFCKGYVFVPSFRCVSKTVPKNKQDDVYQLLITGRVKLGTSNVAVSQIESNFTAPTIKSRGGRSNKYKCNLTGTCNPGFITIAITWKRYLNKALLKDFRKYL